MTGTKEKNNAPVTAPQIKRQSRPMPVFYIVYATALCVSVAVLSLCGRYLWLWLSEYEAYLPKYTAERVYEEYFREPDIYLLAELSGAEFDSFEPIEAVLGYIAEQIEGGTGYAETVSPDPHERMYNVTCGGRRFASFSIGESGEYSRHGFPIYELKSVHLTFTLPDNSYPFLVPEGCILYANGTPVTERYISGEAESTEGYILSGGSAGVRYIPYTVGGFTSAPSFEIKDSTGRLYPLVYGESGVGSIAAKTLTVTIPEGYSLYIGGALIETASLTETARFPSAYSPYLGDAAPLEYVEYSIDGFLTPPAVEVKGKDGGACTLIHSEDGMRIVSQPSYSAPMREEQREMILHTFRRLMLYLQYVEGTKAELRAFFDTTSDAWHGIASIDPSWQFEASSYTFTDECVDEVIEYDSTHFSCRVRLCYIGRRGSAVYTETLDKTVFYRYTDGRYLIYGMVNTDSLEGYGRGGDMNVGCTQQP